MTPRRKQGRPDNILAWLFADPWRKLGAIVLALVSWEYLDKKVNDEHASNLEIRLPGQAASRTSTNNYLRIDINPENYTLTHEDVLDATNGKPLEDQIIKVEMKGEKATIERMKGTLELRYSPTLAQLERAAKEGYLTFGMEDLLHENNDLGADLKSLEEVRMKPERIRLRIRPNATKNLPLAEQLVELDYGDSGLEERLANPEFSHATVDLRGPQQAIQRLPANGPIFLGRVKPVHGDATQVRVELELLPGLKDLVTSNPVFVTYTVEPDWQPVEFKNVPIDIDNRLLEPEQKNPNPFRVEPAEMPLVRLDVKGELWNKLKLVKANAQELAEFQRRHLRLAVYPEPDDLTRKEGRRPVFPAVEFVLLEDIPTPRKGKDFRVRDLEHVNIILKKNQGK